MLETIGNLLGNIAPYVVAVLGLIALYFLWVAFREWRVGARAAFGIERDIATSEMIGALGRVVILVIAGLVVLGLGRLGEESASTDGTPAGPTRTPIPTTSVFQTLTPESGEPVPTSIPTDTPQAMVTDVPLLPDEPTQPPVVEPTPQTATVIVFGGVWLRDAPNGGTIDVLPQGTVVEFLEGREFAGSFEWQFVRVLSTPPGSQALVDREGWVAFSPDFLQVSP